MYSVGCEADCAAPECRRPQQCDTPQFREKQRGLCCEFLLSLGYFVQTDPIQIIKSCMKGYGAGVGRSAGLQPIGNVFVI